MFDLFSGPILIVLLSGGFAAILIYTSKRFLADSNDVVEKINRLLPQTQCAQCGHPGCRPYAEAIAQGEAINHCPPGGDSTIDALANLLGRELIPLDESFGSTVDEHIVVIREADCIGCTLCIQACPVDAIIGASQQMHTVLSKECTGCDLCIAPCPVDCIDIAMLQTPTPVPKEKPSLDRTAQGSEKPCIRCGECESVCPKNLAPQELFLQRHANEAMDQLKLDDCIECMICDRVCPSHISLTNSFISTKHRIEQEMLAQQKGQQIETKYLERNKRIETAKQQVKRRSGRENRAALLNRLKVQK